MGVWHEWDGEGGRSWGGEWGKGRTERSLLWLSFPGQEARSPSWAPACFGLRSKEV